MHEGTSKLTSHDMVQNYVLFYSSVTCSCNPVAAMCLLQNWIAITHLAEQMKFNTAETSLTTREKWLLKRWASWINPAVWQASVLAIDRRREGPEENVLIINKHYFCLALSLNTILGPCYLFTVGLPSFRLTSEARSRVTTTEYKLLVNKSLCSKNFQKNPSKDCISIQGKQEHSKQHKTCK